ncbi:MAG: ABA4-like family protein [Vicinamibacteraceae bacterium]
MTPDQMFSIVNPLAALSWLALIVVPRRAAIVSGLVVPVLLAALYAGLIASHWSGADGGFSTLSEVARLFANRWLLLAGWVHYLCFDLLVGTWEVQDARARGMSHLLVVPCLILTFLFGPAGWLLYKGLASIQSRSKA